MDYEGQARRADLDQLQLLAIFHYALAGLALFFSCFPMLYMGMGVLVLTEASQDAGAGLAGGLFIAFGLVLLLFVWFYAGLMVFAGRSLQTRRRWTFCVVMAALSCLNLPFGTILGVFTLVVLARPSVKDMFEANVYGGVER